MSNEYFGTRWTFYFGYCSLEEEQFRAHRSKRGEEIFWYDTSGFRLISDRALIWRVSILWRKGKRRIYIYIYNGIIQSVVDTRLQRNCRPSVTSWRYIHVERNVEKKMAHLSFDIIYVFRPTFLELCNATIVHCVCVYIYINHCDAMSRCMENRKLVILETKWMNNKHPIAIKKQR